MRKLMHRGVVLLTLPVYQKKSRKLFMQMTIRFFKGTRKVHFELVEYSLAAFSRETCFAIVKFVNLFST